MSKHVASVGEQCQRVGEKSSHRFRDEGGAGEDDGPQEPAPVSHPTVAAESGFAGHSGKTITDLVAYRPVLSGVRRGPSLLGASGSEFGTRVKRKTGNC